MTANKCKKLSLLLRLFGEMFYISLTVLGGGFAIIAAAEERFSRGDRPRKRDGDRPRKRDGDRPRKPDGDRPRKMGEAPWLEDGELLDHLPLFQALPGIIAVHAAVYIGRKVAGVKGAVAAVCGAVLPSVIIFLVVSSLYAKIPLNHPLFEAGFTGLRAALTGIIAAMVVRCWKKNTDGQFGYSLTFIVFAAVSYFKISAAPIILGSLAIGLLWGLSPTHSRGLSPGGDGSSRGPSPEGKIWGQTPKRVNEIAGLLVIMFIFIKYGAIAFGGGYVLVPAYFKDFVGEGARYLQLGYEEFGNMLALTQMTPGPIGINGATFFGYRLGVAQLVNGCGGAGGVPGVYEWTAVGAGVAGAVIASLSVVIPGFVALNLALGPLAKYRGSRVGKCVETMIRPVTLGMMMSATWTFLSMCLSPTGVALTMLAFAAALSRRIGIVPLIILMAAAAVGVSAVLPR